MGQFYFTVPVPKSRTGKVKTTHIYSVSFHIDSNQHCVTQVYIGIKRLFIYIYFTEMQPDVLIV